MIFAPGLVLFGTKADTFVGLDVAQKSQWKGIWPNIRDFRPRGPTEPQSAVNKPT